MLTDAELIAEGQAQAKRDGAPNGWPKRYDGSGPWSVGGIAYYDCFSNVADDEDYQYFRKVAKRILDTMDE